MAERHPPSERAGCEDRFAGELRLLEVGRAHELRLSKVGLDHRRPQLLYIDPEGLELPEKALVP